MHFFYFSTSWITKYCCMSVNENLYNFSPPKDMIYLWSVFGKANVLIMEEVSSKKIWVRVKRKDLSLYYQCVQNVTRVLYHFKVKGWTSRWSIWFHLAFRNYTYISDTIFRTKCFSKLELLKKMQKIKPISCSLASRLWNSIRKFYIF